MSNARHTPGPWFVVNDGTHEEPFMSVKAARVAGREPRHEVALCATGDSPQEMETANAYLIAAAPRMSVALQRAAHLLAELPQEQQTPQMLALRSEIVETIKQATPEYYGKAKGEQ